MKLVLHENQEVSESYKNALISSKIAFRRWRSDFISSWIKDGYKSSFMLNGERYIGGSFTMDRVDTPEKQNMADLLGFDDATIDEFVSFMNSDGTQDIDLRFSPKLCTSEYCVSEYLKLLYSYIYTYIQQFDGNYTEEVVFRINDLPTHDVWDITGPTDIYNSFDDILFPSILDPRLKWNMKALLYTLEFTTGIFSANNFVTIETRTAEYTHDGGVEDPEAIGTYTYDVYAFNFSYSHLPSFLNLSSTAQSVHSAIYRGDSVDDYLPPFGELDGLENVYEYAIFERLSWAVEIHTDHSYLDGNQYYLKESWLRSVSSKDFTEVLAYSIEIHTNSESSWPLAGTFLGDAINALEGLGLAFVLGIGALTDALERLPVLNVYYYAIYYALEFGGLSEGDLNNIDHAARWLQARAIVYVATLGIGAAAEGTEVAVEASFDIFDFLEYGAEAYLEFQQMQLENSMQDIQEEEEKEEDTDDDAIELSVGIDSTDMFYAGMVYDPSELELEDYFEDPTLL